MLYNIPLGRQHCTVSSSSRVAFVIDLFLADGTFSVQDLCQWKIVDIGFVLRLWPRVVDSSLDCSSQCWSWLDNLL